MTSPNRIDLRPDVENSRLAIASPGSGDGHWAGGPSAVLGADGAIYLAYRLRRPVGEGRGFANVVARSQDGVHFETVAQVLRDQLECASLERPALVQRPDGGWRLFLSLSTLGSKHWWIDALDADRIEDLGSGERFTVWPGDSTEAVKDPVVLVDADGHWHAWICCHPLTEVGEEDRMTTRYAMSSDGRTWTWGDVVLAPEDSGWDRRGRRVASVLPRPDGSVLALYDGRASAQENWYERTAVATGARIDGPLTPDEGLGVAHSPYGRHTLRYASVIDLGDGTARVYFESAAADGSNEIRTQVITLANAR